MYIILETKDKYNVSNISNAKNEYSFSIMLLNFSTSSSQSLQMRCWKNVTKNMLCVMRPDYARSVLQMF